MTDGLTPIFRKDSYVLAPRPTERRYRGGYRRNRTHPTAIETMECVRRFTQLDDAV
jgi:hypothetical protein